MIPFFEKLQKEVDELKAVVIDKDNIIGMSRSDLVKLNTQKNQLEQKVSLMEEQLKADASKLRDVYADKERLERRFTDASNNLQTLREEVGNLRSEMVVKKDREQALEAKSTNDDLKIYELEAKTAELERRIAQYESGSSLNQNIIDAVMNEFFSSDEWRGAQIDNFITSGNKKISSNSYIIITHPFQSSLTHYMFSFSSGYSGYSAEKASGDYR